MVKVLQKIFGSQNERELKRIWPIVEKVNGHEPAMQQLSDEALQAKTPEFRQRLEDGEELDDILPEAFAVVREAAVRVLGMRHYDVQIVGGVVLHEGTIAEMKTGEGKTLCATLPVYLNALTGKGVHVVTVNDYLARRDAEWMGQVYNFLGLSVGCVYHGVSYEERYDAYRADITYGQNNEFGFDYLRDNMKHEAIEMVQRKHHYAIVDEVDSILIDEARTPLIISGPSDKPTETYGLANEVVKKLIVENKSYIAENEGREEEDKVEELYNVELKSKQVMLTDRGVKRIEEILELGNLYDPGNIQIVHHVTQALKAHVAQVRDVDYVVRDGKIIIVDEFTGRLMAGRRWSDGLHQAVEAKEGVRIEQENQTLATITFQNYFRMYEKLAGMTGTADTEAVEFKKIYNLEVVMIPTNEPMVRDDCPDVVFATEKGKFEAVIDEIKECNERGQPVLVGTASIAKSEMLSKLLSQRKIDHHVLNAKQHEQEAHIVAQAGRLGSVTISTNMAGRGTDIVLGGNPEFLAAEEAGNHDHEDEGFREAFASYEQTCGEEKQQVLDAGGLHILGTERHESRRIDNQLRGRSGRQGDPGSSRFYVSLEDDLMRRFGGERMQAIMSRVGLQEDEAIEGTLVARAIENAQKKVEGYHFDIRKHLLEYDDVMNKQREVLYTLRSRVLGGDEIEDEILEMVPDIIEEMIVSRANEKVPVSEWDIAGMFEGMRHIFGLQLSADDYENRKEELDKSVAQELFELFREAANERYEQRKMRFGPERMVKLERLVFLQAIDHFWKEHLQSMDHLKEGIWTRGYGQRNPLHEYQRESFELLNSMMAAIKTAVLQNIFIPELPTEQELEELEAAEREQQRAQEERAQATHEDVTEGGSEALGDNRARAAQSGDGNRRQRRRQEAMSRRMDERDYAPTAVQDTAGSAAKRANRKKKKKAAKKSKKKSR